MQAHRPGWERDARPALPAGQRAVALDVALDEVGREPERRLGRAQELRERIDEHEARRPVGMRRREQHQGERRLRRADQDRPLAPGRVQHGADVVHPGLHRRQPARLDRVRGAPATEVACDEPPARAEASQPAGNDRVFPEEVDRRRRPRREEDVRFRSGPSTTWYAMWLPAQSAYCVSGVAAMALFTLTQHHTGTRGASMM